MACSCCGFGDAADRQFTARKASQELALYRRNGPGVTTCLLRDGLVDAKVVGGALLDIGAGVGALTFELLDRGITRAVAVDASSFYLDAARDEARRRGRADAIEFIHSDFVDVASRLPSASVVTLDRVVCCYPLYEPLLREALRLADRCIALSYPKDRWYVRAAFAGENGRRWLAGNTFRAFVHPPVSIERTIHRAGFMLSGRRETWIWSTDVYVRS